MPAERHFGLVLAVALCAAACGGNGTASTAEATTTAAAPATTTSTTTTSTTSTTTPDAGPLAGLLREVVADPFFDTGHYAMAYGDEAGSYVISKAELTGVGGYLRLAPFSPAPAVAGLGEDQLLVEALVEPYPDGPPPRAIVLYGLGVGGWNPYVAIDAAAILAYLETTTDYQARRLEGPVSLSLTPSVFDWTGSAHLVTRVGVRPLASDEAIYTGEIECTFTGTLECETLSDDGVLRLGDEGEDVAALQVALAGLGYYAGAGEGTYDEATEEAVRLFQRDYRLDIDGKAGPQTQRLLEEVVSGESDIVLASQDGVGEVAFGTPATEARAALVGIFGTPDASTGWFSSPCSGADWQEITWDGFIAIFTDRNGSRQFDGWQVDDLGDLPSWLYFAGGIRPTWRWSDFEDAGARFDRDPDDVAFWHHDDLGYNNGRFVNPPAGAPAATARIRGFGAGTGGFVSC